MPVNASHTPRFLVTAGPTREFLDPIRYLSNLSSGRMGYALAAVAREVSPRVTLVSGPTALRPPDGVEFVPVTTAAEMAAAVLERFEQVDVVIMAAAVCDFRPRRPAASKIKKQTFAGSLELEPTPDILAELGRRKTTQMLVGFAAETANLLANARGKLVRKRLDLIVANDQRAFESDDNAVTLLWPDGRQEAWPAMPKHKVARRIIERVTGRGA
jgi:phosphopantothenoylcysteine decarboxylase/phosphopantothenate--cysteine ligase